MSTKAPERKVVVTDQVKSPLKHVGGSNRATFNNEIINAAIRAAFVSKNQAPEQTKAVTDSTVFAMTAFKPADEIEGMIAAQAVAMHYAAMECSRRAMIPEQPFEVAQGFRKAAANSSRAFVGLLDALDRKRGKGGQQKVTVEHVHVYAGGKAIVGSVNQSAGGGGGVAEQTAEEPRASPAALEHDATPGTVLPPMRGKDPERDPVPIPRHAERKMPDARRRKYRTANG